MKTILIAILAVLSIVLVGVSAYQKSNQPPEPMPIVINQPAVNQPVVKQPVATTSDEIAGWKVYRNIEEGIELKYPANFLTKENKVNIGEVSTPTNLFSLGIYDGEISKFESRVFHFTETNKQVETEMFDGIDPNFGKNIIVGGVSGFTRQLDNQRGGLS